MMDLTEAMFVNGIQALDGKLQRPWGEKTVDYTPPWPRKKYAVHDLQQLKGEHCPTHIHVKSPDEAAAGKQRAWI